MKKVILLNLALISVALLHGQTIENEIKKAEKLLKQKSYKEAIQELKSAVSIIENEQLNSMKADLLPEKILSYSKVKNRENAEFSKSYISGKRVELKQIYAIPSSNKQEINMDNPMIQTDPKIIFTITNNPEKICEVVNFFFIEGTNTMQPTESFETIQYKGYKAIYQSDELSNYERLSVIIGGACLEIYSESIIGKNVIVSMADIIDINKIIEYFGK
jgi:hypothetical protein